MEIKYLWCGQVMGIIQKACSLSSFRKPWDIIASNFLIEKDGHSTTANPCKASASKCKLVVFDEPEESEPLRASLIKSLSGGDALIIIETSMRKVSSMK